MLYQSPENEEWWNMDKTTRAYEVGCKKIERVGYFGEPIGMPDIPKDEVCNAECQVIAIGFRFTSP